ncbi:MAG TPA: flavin reductase [Clostridiales bacterium]|nr:flavin reductase family protein [Eubacteriales bacterium]HBR31795.1 flavin reductase [Clostridiales bacterium]
MLKQILPEQFGKNVFDAIGKQKMLITAKKQDGSYNTMTASWGGMGVLWNKNVFMCFIRPQRYTNEFAEQSDEITLCWLEDGFKDAYKICGSKSGRDCDKTALAGLTPVIDGDFVYFEQAEAVLCGKKLYVNKIKESGFIGLDPALFYKDDYHIVYIYEIKKVLVK